MWSYTFFYIHLVFKKSYFLPLHSRETTLFSEITKKKLVSFIRNISRIHGRSTCFSVTIQIYHKILHFKYREIICKPNKQSCNITSRIFQIYSVVVKVAYAVFVFKKAGRWTYHQGLSVLPFLYYTKLNVK